MQSLWYIISIILQQLSYIDKTEDSGEEDHIDAVDAIDNLHADTDNLQAHVHPKSDENSAYYVWSTEGSEDEVDHQSEKEDRQTVYSLKYRQIYKEV